MGNSIAITLALASFTLIFFWKLSETLTDEARSDTATWLRGLPLRGQSKQWPTLFIALFDRLFGHGLWSRRFFVVSASATVFFGTIISLAYLLFQPTLGRGTWEDIGTWARLLVLIPFLNIFVDYASVVESRIAMRWMTRHDSSLWRMAILAVDFALTTAVHMAFTALALAVVCFLRNLSFGWVQGDALAWVCHLHDAVREFSSSYRQGFTFELSVHPSFQVSFYTTFATSVWVWLYFLSGNLVRVWSRMARLLRKPLDKVDSVGMIDAHPVKLMGLVSAALTLIVGLVVSLVV